MVCGGPRGCAGRIPVGSRGLLCFCCCASVFTGSAGVWSLLLLHLRYVVCWSLEETNRFSSGSREEPAAGPRTSLQMFGRNMSPVEPRSSVARLPRYLCTYNMIYCWESGRRYSLHCHPFSSSLFAIFNLHQRGAYACKRGRC